MIQPPMTRNCQVFYTGRVQGVGFRWTVRHIATGYDVTGWVRNLIDGRVELQAGGEAAEVEAFLAAISASHLGPHIKEVEKIALSTPPAGHGFHLAD